jgi:hypothetical protein
MRGEEEDEGRVRVLSEEREEDGLRFKLATGFTGRMELEYLAPVGPRFKDRGAAPVREELRMVEIRVEAGAAAVTALLVLVGVEFRAFGVTLEDGPLMTLVGVEGREEPACGLGRDREGDEGREEAACGLGRDREGDEGREEEACGLGRDREGDEGRAVEAEATED